MDRHATAVWQGTLKEGKGTIDSQSGALKSASYSFKGRIRGRERQVEHQPGRN